MSLILASSSGLSSAGDRFMTVGKNASNERYGFAVAGHSIVTVVAPVGSLTSVAVGTFNLNAIIVDESGNCFFDFAVAPPNGTQFTIIFHDLYQSSFGAFDTAIGYGFLQFAIPGLYNYIKARVGAIIPITVKQGL